jgi:hypothetical protein
MKNYLLAVHHTGDEPELTPEEMQPVFEAVDKFNAELQAAGTWTWAGGLMPPDTATVVRHRDGEVLVTDGPFGETKEFLGGFWIIKAADLDEALAWAAKGAEACRQPVEVRPFQDEAEDATD